MWDRYNDKTRFRVNIDATMNLELMFWAGQNGGNPQYAAMATQHALRAATDLVRPDGSTYMCAGYDQTTGALLGHFTTQGYSTDSTWARGQTWGPGSPRSWRTAPGTRRRDRPTPASCSATTTSSRRSRYQKLVGQPVA